jgi:phosphohistidine phosphatase
VRRTIAPVRQLWFLRHAKSAWDDASLPDVERPLAARGRRSAEAMGGWLATSDVRPELVLCSSARRARETLAIVLPGLGDRFEVRVEPVVYTFDQDVLLGRVAAVPDDVRRVLVIGHNPAIEESVGRLAARGERLADLRQKYPTGALAALSLEVDTWQAIGPGCATLTAFVTPRDLEPHQT